MVDEPPPPDLAAAAPLAAPWTTSFMRFLLPPFTTISIQVFTVPFPEAAGADGVLTGIADFLAFSR